MEEKFINLIKETIGSDSASYIGDDCAVVKLGSEDYFFSLDVLAEDNHFDTEIFSPYEIGWKAAAVNISDICAMGGEPLFMLVGLSLKKDTKEEWITEFYKGMRDCASQYGGAKIIGGDIVSSDLINVSVSIFGKARNNIYKRSSAKPGDKVCVTGKFGNSKQVLGMLMQGLDVKDTEAEYLLRPKPRYKESKNLEIEGALMDSSDGLVVSLHEIAKASGVRVEIDSNKIPKDDHINLDNALYGGEELELVGAFKEIPQDFIQIGSIHEGQGVYESHSGEYLGTEKSYKHF